MDCIVPFRSCSDDARDELELGVPACRLHRCRWRCRCSATRCNAGSIRGANARSDGGAYRVMRCCDTDSPGVRSADRLGGARGRRRRCLELLAGAVGKRVRSPPHAVRACVLSCHGRRHRAAHCPRHRRARVSCVLRVSDHVVRAVAGGDFAHRQRAVARRGLGRAGKAARTGSARLVAQIHRPADGEHRGVQFPMPRIRLASRRRGGRSFRRVRRQLGIRFGGGGRPVSAVRVLVRGSLRARVCVSPVASAHGAGHGHCLAVLL